MVEKIIKDVGAYFEPVNSISSFDRYSEVRMY